MTTDHDTADHDTAAALLTPRELAHRWGLSAATLANQRSARVSPVPYIKLGSSIRYPLDDVVAYEKACLVAA